MLSRFCIIGAVTTTAFVLIGCASSPQMGHAPDPVPPKLVSRIQRNAAESAVLVWDRPSAFARLSGYPKSQGDAACLMVRPDLEAIGFHPTAQDRDGKTIEGGGYFCVIKSIGEKPAAEAPKLVRTNGVLGWDKPNAFGVLPESEKVRGNAVCSREKLGFQAVAFHPAAKDESGEPVVGGGFFCAPQQQVVKATV